MNLTLPIYLDHNATTPVDPRVLDAMLPYFSEHYGNAASRSHSFGWKAEEAVENARSQIASLIGATAQEIVLTSGATESDNLAIKGAVEQYAEKGNHVITVATEHKAVLDPVEHLAKLGCEITVLEVDEFGQVRPEQLADAMTDRTVLVSVMAANNETGVIQPIPEIARLVREKGVLFHTDATQAVGKLPIDVDAMGIDLLSGSAHKMYGPKGVGALYVRRNNPRVRLAEQMHGGGHEKRMRSGTLNVPGIVGFGKAASIAAEDMAAQADRQGHMRNQLERDILSQLGCVRRNGHATQRLPNTSNLSFAFVEGESIMLKIKAIAVSSGSACSSASLEPSYVLQAMGLGDALAHGSLRFSLGRDTDAGQIEYVAEHIVQAVTQLREMSPLWEQALKTGQDQAGSWNTAEDVPETPYELPAGWPSLAPA
jgi:cysteine desulfurase